MLLKSTKTVASFSGLFFMVSVLLCAYLFYELRVQKNHYEEQNVARAEREAHKDELASLIRTLSATKDERASLTSRVVKDENVINILGLVESIGKEQGVSLTTNSLTVEPINATFETLVMNVTMKGSYASLIQVLKITEQLPYQSTVGKVHFERGDGVTWSGAFELRITKFKKV